MEQAAQVQSAIIMVFDSIRQIQVVLLVTCMDYVWHHQRCHVRNFTGVEVNAIAPGAGSRRAFFYNGATPVVVSASGQLGVGTGTPNSSSLLEITGTAGTANVRMGSLSSNAVATSWSPSANDGIITADTNGELLKRRADSVVLSIARPFIRSNAWKLVGNSGINPRK
jgi:hypothetical protein